MNIAKEMKEGNILKLTNGDYVIVDRVKDMEKGCIKECCFVCKDGSCERALEKLVPNLWSYPRVHSWRTHCFLDMQLCFRKLKGGV